MFQIQAEDVKKVMAGDMIANALRNYKFVTQTRCFIRRLTVTIRTRRRIASSTIWATIIRKTLRPSSSRRSKR